MFERLIHWVFYAVIASLVPLFADWLINSGDKKPISAATVFGSGKLLLVALAIAFPAFGSLIMSDVSGIVRGVFGGFGLASLALTSILYSHYSFESDTSHFALVTSIVLFGGSALVGALSVAVAVKRS